MLSIRIQIPETIDQEIGIRRLCGSFPKLGANEPDSPIELKFSPMTFTPTPHRIERTKSIREFSQGLLF
jgi:hypothetical protein